MNIFRLARCNDLIRLKAAYKDLWYSEDQAWGLKQLGTLFVVDILKTLQPQRVLEIGAGFNLFFDTWCHNNGIEYWMCDAPGFYDAQTLSEANEQRRHTTYVAGWVGQGVTELPDNFFDAVFSISVVEHVPTRALAVFYDEINRILNCNGTLIQTLDVEANSQRHLFDIQNLQSLGYCNYLHVDDTWDFTTLFEPLSIQYTYYYGKTRDMWETCISDVSNQYGTFMIALSHHSRTGTLPS